MDDDVKYLIERIDKLEERSVERINAVEERLAAKIDKLEGFRNKIIGVASLTGGVAGILADLFIRK